MAQLTKAQARSLVQNLIDDTAAKLWSAANLDILIEGAIDELYGELLDQFAWLRSTEASLTPVTPGTIDLTTALTRFYRLQAVVRDNQTYWPADQKDVMVANNVAIVAPPRSYAVLGNLLHLFPYALTTTYVRYSSRPVAFSSLAEGTAVDWPDGYHMAYIYDAASKAMEKGDREESTRLGKRSEQSLYRLKAFLRKQQVGPIMPWVPNNSLEWGSTT